jgi:hypothetical protein
MSSKRIFWIQIAVLLLLVGSIFAAAYFVHGMLVKQSDTIKNQRLQIQTLDAESTALTKAKKDVVKYQDLALIAKNIVPQDKNQAQTVREIVNIAASKGVKIGSITFPTSSLGSAPGVIKGGGQSQLIPVPGLAGVYNLQLTVQSSSGETVPYSRFIAFLDGLEHNRRTALVTSITLTPDANNPNNVGFNLTLDEYIKP